MNWFLLVLAAICFGVGFQERKDKARLFGCVVFGGIFAMMAALTTNWG